MLETPLIADELLLENDANYHRLANLMPNAVFATDTEGIITYYNQKAVELWGREPRLNDPTETRYCGSWKLYYPDGKLMLHNECPMSEVLRTGKAIREREIMVEQPGGARASVLVNIDPIFSQSGKLTGAINVIEDITVKKKSIEAMVRLAAIVTSSEDAIISKTLKGIITSWNRGAEKLFGYKEEEMLGKSIMLLIPPDRQSDETLIIDKISKGELVDHFETVRLDKNGNEIPISLTVSPIRDQNGKIIGASKIARNISSQLLIQKQLQEHSEKLEALNNYKDEFIGMASHELKTPLTSIKANLQLLERKLYDNLNKDFVSKTLKHIGKLNSLVSDLLDVSKIQAGKLQLNKVNFDMRELLEESVETVQHTTVTHKIRFTSPAQTLTVHADRERIEQVIINLLTNAVKYSPAANEVLVDVAIEKEGPVISIQDFGIGIARPDLEKVFNRFYRVEGLEPHYSGLGIGLYIAHEIIKRHGGEMWVRSEPGKGSTFFFKL